MSAEPPPEWERLEDDGDGTPVWRHFNEPLRVSTWDFELLDYLDLTLRAFRDPKRPGLAIPTRQPVPGEGCVWTDFRDSA